MTWWFFPPIILLLAATGELAAAVGASDLETECGYQEFDGERIGYYLASTNSCYVFYEQKSNFGDQYTHCSSENILGISGKVMQVNTSQELQAVHSVHQWVKSMDFKEDEFWIDLKRCDDIVEIDQDIQTLKVGEYCLNNGQSPIPFDIVEDGAIIGTVDDKMEECLVVKNQGPKTKLDGSDCENDKAVVCQFQLVQCAVSSWTDWSACSTTCGDGTKYRNRTVTQPPVGPGELCPKLTETENCNETVCPVDCAVSSWTDWSACSTTCGDGTKYKNRTITQEQVGNGEPCPNLTEIDNCNETICPGAPNDRYKRQADDISTNGCNCPQEGYIVGNKCYFEVGGQFSWIDARLKCQEEDADLPVAKTALENEQLEETKIFFNTIQVWIGLTDDAAKDGQWRWIDDTAPDYLNWYDSNDKNFKYCAFHRSPSTKWYRTYCAHAVPSNPISTLCEKDCPDDDETTMNIQQTTSTTATTSSTTTPTTTSSTITSTTTSSTTTTTTTTSSTASTTTTSSTATTTSSTASTTTTSSTTTTTTTSSTASTTTTSSTATTTSSTASTTTTSSTATTTSSTASTTTTSSTATTTSSTASTTSSTATTTSSTASTTTSSSTATTTSSTATTTSSTASTTTSSSTASTTTTSSTASTTTTSSTASTTTTSSTTTTTTTSSTASTTTSSSTASTTTSSSTASTTTTSSTASTTTTSSTATTTSSTASTTTTSSTASTTTTSSTATTTSSTASTTSSAASTTTTSSTATRTSSTASTTTTSSTATTTSLTASTTTTSSTASTTTTSSTATTTSLTASTTTTSSTATTTATRFYIFELMSTETSTTTVIPGADSTPSTKQQLTETATNMTESTIYVADPCIVFDEPCENNGTCGSDVDNYWCICVPPWTGANCTEYINEETTDRSTVFTTLTTIAAKRSSITVPDTSSTTSLEIVSSMDTSTTTLSSSSDEQTSAPRSQTDITESSTKTPTAHGTDDAAISSNSDTSNTSSSSAVSSPSGGTSTSSYLSTPSLEIVSSKSTSSSTISSTAALPSTTSKTSTMVEIGPSRSQYSTDPSTYMTTNQNKRSSNGVPDTSSTISLEILSSITSNTTTVTPSSDVPTASSSATSFMAFLSSMSTSPTASKITTTRKSIMTVSNADVVPLQEPTRIASTSASSIASSMKTTTPTDTSNQNSSLNIPATEMEHTTPQQTTGVPDTTNIPQQGINRMPSNDIEVVSAMKTNHMSVYSPTPTTPPTSSSTLKTSTIAANVKTGIFYNSSLNTQSSSMISNEESGTPSHIPYKPSTVNQPTLDSNRPTTVMESMPNIASSIPTTDMQDQKTKQVIKFGTETPSTVAHDPSSSVTENKSSESLQVTMQTTMIKDETKQISEANTISPTMGKFASPDENQSSFPSTDDITSQPSEHPTIKTTSPVTTQLISGVEYVHPKTPSDKITTSMKENWETLKTVELELSTTEIRATPETTSAKLNFYGIFSKSTHAMHTTALGGEQQEVTKAYMFTPKSTKDVAQEIVTSRLPSVSMEGSTPDINLSTASKIDNMASKTTASVPTNSLEYMTLKTHDVSELTENVTDGKLVEEPIPEIKNTTESTSIGQNFRDFSSNSTYPEFTSFKDNTESSSYTAHSIPGTTKHTTSFPKLFEKIISESTLTTPSKLATTTVQERQTYGIDIISQTETSSPSVIGLQENGTESILKTTEKLTNSPLNSASPILPAKPSLQTAAGISSVLPTKTTPQATPKVSSISSSSTIKLSPQPPSNMSTIPSDKTSSLETSDLSSISYRTKLAYKATSAHESPVTTKASIALTFLDVTQTRRRDETIANTHDMNTTPGDKFGSALASTTRLESRPSTIFNTASADQLSSTARKFMDLLKTSSEPMKTLQRSTTEATNGQRTAHGDETPRATSSDEHMEFNQNVINPSVEPSTINLDGRTTEEQLIRETTSRPGFESLERFTRPRTKNLPTVTAKKYAWQEGFDDTLEEVPPPIRIEDMGGPGRWFGGGGPGVTDSNVSTTITPDQIQELLKPIVRPTPRHKEDSKDFIPEPMSEIVQFVSDIEHYMGCAFIIVTLALMIIAFLIVFRTRNPEGILMSELFISLLIAHLVTMLMREPRLLSGWPKVTCLIAGMIYQYAYLSVYILLVLLSLQVLLIYGKFSPGGWVLGPYISFFLAYSVPMFVVLITFFSMPTSYTTDWTCIGNMNTHLASVLFIPAIVLFSTAFIVSESGGIFNRDLNHLLEYDAESMTRNGFVKSFLVIGGPMITFNHACTSVAVYTQQITWFTIVFALNISTTIAIVMLCVPIEDKVRQFAVRVWNFMRERCCCRPRVAPEEPPVEEIN